ncbi:MAG: 50S ribosomal protein L15e [Thermoplasmatota archaeon]
MAKSLYGHLADRWTTWKSDENLERRRELLYQWRREPVVNRVERPTRLDRARTLGYRAKQGYVIVRTRVRRGSLRRIVTRVTGHKPSSMGFSKITASKSIKRIAEERVSKKYPNLQVLNSYWVGEDGKHKFFEIILVDPNHPVILADPKISWIADPGNRKRVFRGRTSAGRKGRGLYHKGKGAEKNRPSLRAKNNRRQ